MKKSLKHRAALLGIIKDVRLSPNRRLLAELLALWVDCDDQDEKSRLFKIIEANYGSSQKTLWLEKRDIKNPSEPANEAEAEASQKLKEYFAALERGEGEISESNIYDASE